VKFQGGSLMDSLVVRKLNVTIARLLVIIFVLVSILSFYAHSGTNIVYATNGYFFSEMPMPDTHFAISAKGKYDDYGSFINDDVDSYHPGTTFFVSALGEDNSYHSDTYDWKWNGLDIVKEYRYQYLQSKINVPEKCILYKVINNKVDYSHPIKQVTAEGYERMVAVLFSFPYTDNEFIINEIGDYVFEYSSVQYEFTGGGTADSQKYTIDNNENWTKTDVQTLQKFVKIRPATPIVYFNSLGGNKVESRKYICDEKFGQLPSTKKTGYKFVGWYTKQSGGIRITETSNVSFVEPTTLYAHYTAKKYTVKFNANKGKVTTKTKKYTYAAKYKSLPKVTRKGYKFNGWYTKKSGGSKISKTTKVRITKTTTLYAHWTKR
jgi:uncharacterized repeat protein (TIGR02543 family)